MQQVYMPWQYGMRSRRTRMDVVVLLIRWFQTCIPIRVCISKSVISMIAAISQRSGGNGRVYLSFPGLPMAVMSRWYGPEACREAKFTSLWMSRRRRSAFLMLAFRFSRRRRSCCGLSNYGKPCISVTSTDSSAPDRYRDSSSSSGFFFSNDGIT